MTKYIIFIILVYLSMACSSPITPTNIPAPLVPSTLTLDSTSGTGADAGTATVRATVKNKTALVVPGTTVKFTATAGTLVPSDATTNANGVATVSLKSEPGTSVTVTATAGFASNSIAVALTAAPPKAPLPVPPIPLPPIPPLPVPPVPRPPTTPAPSYGVTLSVSPAVPLVDQPVTFTVTATPLNGAEPATKFSWRFANGSAPVETTTPFVTFEYGATGTFLVSVTASGGVATGTGSLNITVSELIPVVAVSCSVGIHVTFQTTCVATATLNGVAVLSTNIIDTSWDFGEGFPPAAMAGNVSPPYTYLFAATFTVRASVRVVGATKPGVGTTTTTILP